MFLSYLLQNLADSDTGLNMVGWVLNKFAIILQTFPTSPE